MWCFFVVRGRRGRWDPVQTTKAKKKSWREEVETGEKDEEDEKPRITKKELAELRRKYKDHTWGFIRVFIFCLQSSPNALVEEHNVPLN